MKLNHERSSLLPIFGSRNLNPIKFAYYESFSCGIMLMTNIERYYQKNNIKDIESLIEDIKHTTRYRTEGNWHTNIIQFSITDRHQELVDSCKKLCSSYTKFHKNYNSGNGIAVFTIECDLKD